jgi:hypothetical protein
MGEMKRATAREEQDRRTQDRFASTIVIAASIIAAVRLAREQEISRFIFPLYVFYGTEKFGGFLAKF